MRFKVISLRRTPERLKKFKEINSHTSFEWREAVDGQNLDIEPYIEQGWFEEDMKKYYTRGVFALAVTEIQLWYECIISNENYTICCDDVYLNRNFHKIVSDIDSFQSDFWDLIMWGANPDQPVEYELYQNMGIARLQIDHKTFADNIDKFVDLDIRPTLNRCFFGSGTICYTINPRSAKWMMENILPVRQYHDTWGNYGLDHSILYEMPRMKTFISIPFLAATKNDGEESLTFPPNLPKEQQYFS